MKFVATMLLAVPAIASAHHSVAYYGDEVIELAGEIVDVEWRNPHIRLTVEVVSDRGVREIWRMEGNSIYNLRRSGITADLFPVGERLIVSGNRSTRDERMMLAGSVLFSDGREFLLWDLEGRGQVEDRLVDAATEARGIFRVWSVPRGNILPYLQQLADQSFTDGAIAGRASWDMLDNFATRCEPEGMPRIMVNPHPFEFIDLGNEITLRTELYDIERAIHMDRDSPPDDEPWSRLGYSVGIWEDGELVVTTTRINWPYFDNIGTPQSTEMEIVERFKLSDDQTRLDFDITITDPSTFTSAAKLQGHWLALGDTIPLYNCQPTQQ